MYMYCSYYVGNELCNIFALYIVRKEKKKLIAIKGMYHYNFKLF